MPCSSKMRPDHLPRQRGFAIVSAIFLIVALAALGAAIMHFSSVQHVTGAQDLQGSRALAAARAGSEWAVASASVTNVCPPSPTALTFGGFNLSIVCTADDFTDEGVPLRIFSIAATAASGGAPGNQAYVERRVDVVVAR